MKSHLQTFARSEKSVFAFLHVLVLSLSLLLVVAISIDTFLKIPFTPDSLYMKIQFWVCVIFLLDFFVELILARNRWQYFYTHFIFLLIAIPYQNIIAFMGWQLSTDATYLIRFIPLLRGGYAMVILVNWLTNSRISGLFITYLVTLATTIYFASLVFFMAEQSVNSQVHGYGDAIWWAFMDVTTIGSNVIAVTTIGRVLSVVLASLGMMMFPIFTVYITNNIERKNREREARYHQMDSDKNV